MRFAVPLFFMISGFVLELTYPFNAHYGQYLKKRLSKVLIPYVTWSFIYYFFIYTGHSHTIFYSLIEGSASYQLYFIPALFLFYLLFPLLHTIRHLLENKWILSFLFILQCFILAYDYYIAPIPLFSPIHTALLNYFVFIIGIVAANHKEKVLQMTKHWKYLLASSAGLLAYAIYSQGKYFYLQSHNYLSFYSQWRPEVLMYTLVFAGAGYAFFQKIPIPNTIIKTVSRLSFFVFFIHIIILNAVWDFSTKTFLLHNQLLIRNVLFDPIFFSIVLVISFSLAYVSHKMPFVAKITG